MRTLRAWALRAVDLFTRRRIERELAVHFALGVGRGALAARLVRESLVLSVLGGACGVWFLWLTQRALARAALSGRTAEALRTRGPSTSAAPGRVIERRARS